MWRISVSQSLTIVFKTCGFFPRKSMRPCPLRSATSFSARHCRPASPLFAMPLLSVGITPAGGFPSLPMPRARGTIQSPALKRSCWWSRSGPSTSIALASLPRQPSRQPYPTIPPFRPPSAWGPSPSFPTRRAPPTATTCFSAMPRTAVRCRTTRQWLSVPS